MRGLQGAATVSEPVAKQHLAGLTPSDRYALLQFAVPDLRDWLLAVYKAEELSVVPDLKPVYYPDLPEALLSTLKQWEAKNRNRLNARMKLGHDRATSTLRRLMAEPIALARFLVEHGVARWDTMKMSDRVAFAKTRPKRVQQKLRPFIDFVEGRNPFKTERRGRPPKKATSVIKEARQIPILPPDELKARIKDASLRLPDDQYLLYWLVAKLGLTAKKAYGLTLDRVTINQKGKLVIRPADAWIALPKSLAPTMELLARAADSAWPYDEPEKAAPIPVMAAAIPEHRLGTDVFRGETALLRSSAIYAALHEGQLGRKSLAAITGVSLTTIAAMEYMVPADIYSLASHKLVSARNAAILGDGDG